MFRISEKPLAGLYRHDTRSPRVKLNVTHFPQTVKQLTITPFEVTDVNVRSYPLIVALLLKISLATLG